MLKRVGLATIRLVGSAFRAALVGVLAVALIAGGVALADYSATQGSGTTFASVVISAKHYMAMVICDATAGESQCAAVNSSGQVATTAVQSGTWTVQPGNTPNSSAWLVTGTGGTFPVTGTFWPYTLGQQLAASSVPIVLTAAQLSTLTPPAAITNYSLETGGNLATTATNTGTTATNTGTTNTNVGAPGSTACSTDTGSCNINALSQRIAQRISSLITALGSPFQAGGSVGNTSFGAIPQPSSSSTNGLTPSTTAALASSQVVKGSAGNLYSFNISADSTLSGAAWWIMIYDATTAPADGGVTPAKCYAMASGTTSYSAAFPVPVAFATGITIGVSTTGCFTKTASTHAFISGDSK